MARQFNRYQLYRQEEDELSGAVHALELGILYDNTNYPDSYVFSLLKGVY